MLFLLTGTIFNGLYLLHFETTQGKNHLDTNFVKIHSGVIKILSLSCFLLFLVTPAILERHIAKKKIKMAPCKEHFGTKLDQFQSKVLEDLLYSQHLMQIFYFAHTQ